MVVSEECVDGCVRGLLEDRESKADLTVLVEADLVSALAEALTADVEAVLSDDTTLVTADTAVVRVEQCEWENARVSQLFLQ